MIDILSLSKILESDFVKQIYAFNSWFDLLKASI